MKASLVELLACLLHSQTLQHTHYLLVCTHSCFTGGQDAWKAAEAEIVEPPQGLGVLGQEGWFIPKFTAERDASLLSYIGMQGEENRRKMAERFLRPTSWQEYCQEVSDNNCETPDSVATRAPLGEDENTRYFVSDTYTGHFRATEKNDCDTWPLNCTGHIVDYPCGCASFVEQIAYHLDIALDGDGKEKGSGGYTYPQMTDIWYAANYTKSDVVMMWWSPDLLYQTFSRTEAEFHRVSLPPPTQECEESRVSEVDRCSLKQETRVGDAMGACDEDPKPLYKVIASSLYELVFAPDIPEAKYSPAYDAIKLFQISGTQLGELLTSALSDEDYRAGVCQWVVDNMDYARQSIPRTYPRTLQSEEQAKGLGIAAYVVSVLAALSCLATLGTVFHQRGRRVMVFAQVEFLYLILCGLLLVSLGAVISAIPLSDGSCVSIIWLIIMGYTLQLVPLIAKVGAINRLMNAAASMKRVVVRRKSLFGAVVGISGLVCLYLLVWTLLDPPMKANEYELSPGMTVGDETVVIVSPYCTSQNSAWMIASLAWNCILLVCATVLAFQTRSLRQDFNESRTLGLMIYSHFLFVVMRVIMFFFLPAVVNESNLMRCMSLLFATDTIATILIYFVPTFLTKDEQRRMSISTHSGVVMEGANWWNLFSRSQIEGSVIYDGRMRSVVKDSENVGEDDSKDISTVSHHTMTDSNKSDSGDDGLRRRKSCVNCGQDPDHKAVMDDELPVESVASMPSSIQMDCNAP